MSAGATLAISAAMAWPGAAGAATAASGSTAAVTLSADPLGIDIAPWDPVYSNPATFSVVQPLLKKAGIRQIHFGGGVTADAYDWQTNTDVLSGKCGYPPTVADFAAACATQDPLAFSQFSQKARALGAQSFVTVNYGTGTPSMAAAWVKQSQATAGQGVAEWSVGNESYGCWELNNALAGPPENYTGYKPGIDSTCPMVAQGTSTGIQTMATSYAVNAENYMAAMKAQDPSIQIGVPWAFDYTVPGASVGDNSVWNDKVLSTDAQYISFVEAHWYPFGVSIPSDQKVIQSVYQIPSEYAKIRTELDKYVPNAKVVVGETGVSYLATNIPCKPAGALFAAGDVLSWLSLGAQTVDWWPLDTNANPGGTCTHPDEAMFTSTGTPTTPYMGYLLASTLAQPNARLSSLTTSDPANVLAFQSVLPNGKVAVALINTNTSTSKHVTVSSALAGSLATMSYSAGNQNATNTRTVPGATTAAAVASGITLPAESILLLEEGRAPSAISLRTVHAGNTFRAGTRVTLKGKLTLNGVAAPAGVKVKIFRRKTGSKPYRATLTVRTAANGTFRARNLPPAYGKYVYLAKYANSAYKTASHSVVVHVTIAKPILKLKVSAKSVRPGHKVRVTAILRAPHVNRKLTIYAHPRGSRKRVIRHGRINSKDRLTVVFRVRKKTVFTVTFSGDTWYRRASVSVTVKA